jgi:hypothetical protein
MVVTVSHHDAVVPIHYDPHGSVELSNSQIPVLMAVLASARQSGHMSLWCDFVDTIVVAVSHDDVPVPIQCDSIRIVELSNTGPFSVLMALLASARYCGHLVHPLPSFFHSNAS